MVQALPCIHKEWQVYDSSTAFLSIKSGSYMVQALPSIHKEGQVYGPRTAMLP